MKRVLAVASGVALITLVAAARPHQQQATATVNVRCPAGENPASASPNEVHVALGGNVEWRMTGPVASDSIRISLKDARQRWPFDEALPRGASVARANQARRPGTYSYNIHLLCRVPGGGTEAVTIDPDIIVDE